VRFIGVSTSLVLAHDEVFMSINLDELTRLKSDYQSVTGRVCPEFYCPILNTFGEGTGLMDGHILPKCVRSASRATVIQRADVDNPFGVIEAGLCNFLNKPLFDLEELYRLSKRLTVTGKDGIPVPAFFASPKSSPPYPMIELSKGGETIASPHIKTSGEKMDEFRGEVDVEGELVFSPSTLAVSLIKAAQLALFKHMGYRWVFHPSGQYVGSALANVVRQRMDQKAVRNVFDELPNCFNWLPGGSIIEDTIKDRQIIIHFEYYEGSCHPLENQMDCWGLSCVFHMNDHSFVVTLPYSFQRRPVKDVLDRYRESLTGEGVRHSTYFGWVRPDGEIEHSKLRVNMARQPRPQKS
jgi:hypothetical protein